MQATLGQWIQFTGNAAGIIIIVFSIIDLVRNWGGSPELKLIRDQMRATSEQMKETNKHIQGIMEILARKI